MVTWTYVRRAADGNGQLQRDGVVVGPGYSGHGEGLNNPADERIPNVGPIPGGRYQIGGFFDDPQTGDGQHHLGPCIARLTPMPGTDDFGRSGFFIHGDNPAMNHTASDGCIILARNLREMIRASGADELDVV